MNMQPIAARRGAVLLWLVLILAAGCASVQVSSEQDPGADFSTFETFAWLDTEGRLTSDIRVDDELVRETVRTAVEETLTEKGFVRAEPGRADFLVTWFGGIEKRIRTESIENLYSTYGYGTLFRDPRLNPAVTQGTSFEYEEGTLVIDVLDAQRKRILWRGTGVGRVAERRSDDQVRKNLTAAVKRILAPFPPR